MGGRATEEVSLRGKVDSVIRGMRLPINPAWFEGPKAENGAGSGGVFRAESGSDEV